MADRFKMQEQIRDYMRKMANQRAEIARITYETSCLEKRQIKIKHRLAAHLAVKYDTQRFKDRALNLTNAYKKLCGQIEFRQNAINRCCKIVLHYQNRVDAYDAKLIKLNHF